jgi:hypothetical protein
LIRFDPGAMREQDGIRDFLGAVRRRLLLRAGLQAAGYGLALLAVAVLALGLVATAVGPADFWPTVTACLAATLVLAALAAGLVRPAHALRGDRAAARRTGALYPPLASDLLSAVELAAAPAEGERGAATSAVLVRAFRRQVADAVAP